MKKIWEVAKKYDEVIAYAVLTILLLCACFFEPFAWIAAIFAFAMGLYFRKETKVISLMLYMHCFYALFNYQQLFTITLDIIIAGFFIAELLGLYIYRLVKHELKINWKTLIPIALFLVYILLPFHQCQFKDFFAVVFFFTFVYLLFEDRKILDACQIIRLLVVGILVSCVFSWLKSVSPLLQAYVGSSGYYGHVSFRGLAFHPNTLYGLIVIAICGMLMLKQKNKITYVELVLTFIPLFIFGYLTLSRAFIATVFAGIIIFSIFYAFQDKLKALALFGTFVAIICIVGGMFYGETKIYFKRIANDFDNFPVAPNAIIKTENLDQSFDPGSEEWKQGIMDGKIYFDPGRSDLRALYLRDWSSSPKTIFFGRGISRPLIGQMSSHNLYIQELWKHGLVGYAFYLAMIIGAINWKLLKRKWRIYLPMLIVLVPYLMITTVEQCLLDYIRIGLILAAVGFLEQEDSDEAPIQ